MGHSCDITCKTIKHVLPISEKIPGKRVITFLSQEHVGHLETIHPDVACLVSLCLAVIIHYFPNITKL